jgi:calcineurin-like phosphoesterase
MLADDPFATVDTVIRELPERDPIVVVEVHAEATSEKQAMGWYLNGRAALVVGTHTHVATADARILSPLGVWNRAQPNSHARPTHQPQNQPQARSPGPGAGTAYITDLGMCGSQRSVLGRKIGPVLTKMITGMPAPFDVAEEDPRVCGVFVEIDENSGRALAIERIELAADPDAPPFAAA